MVFFAVGCRDCPPDNFVSGNPLMPLFGAHMSIAGGYYRAVEAAADLGMDCVQIFTKNRPNL